MTTFKSIEFSLPFDQILLPAHTYVVGGAVRDALLGRYRQPIDLDLIVPVDAIALAQSIARQYQAGFVLLDAERSIARLVFDGVTVDFAKQMGGSLLADLQRRDYRMNAIAYDLTQQQLFDPLDGLNDIQQHRVRMVAAANLAEDPLRLLRGYRQAAQLGFEIDPETEQAIREIAPCLNQVAAERVLMELRYLFNSSLSNAHNLARAVANGLLDSWLPGSNHPNVPAQLEAVIKSLQIINQQYPALAQLLSTNIQPTINITGASIALWAQLTQHLGSNLPPILNHLTVSNAEAKALTKASAHWPQINELSPTDVVGQYYFFRAVGEFLPIAMVLSLAAGHPLSKNSYLLDRFLDPQDPIAHPVNLVNGSDLIAALKIPPSP